MRTVRSEEELQEHKRQFQRKRWEQEQEQKASLERKRKVAHRLAWMLSWPILIFSILLVIDNRLPADHVNEKVQEAQRIEGGKRYRMISYVLKTSNRTFRISEDTYDRLHRLKVTPTIELQVTPIFHVARSFIIQNGSDQSTEVLSTIYSVPVSFPWLLLLSCLVTLIFLRRYSRVALGFCFLPLFLLFVNVMMLRVW
jgi:hypothetical protein